MWLLSKTPNFDFMGRRRTALMVSALLLIISVGSLAVQGLKLGIDFTGGTLVEVAYDQQADLGAIREGLEKAGFDDAIVQYFGTSQDVLVRLAPREGVSSADISTAVLEALQGTGNVEMRRVEFVGPQVGDELTEQGGLAMLGALLLVLVYVMVRFEKRFAIGSVIALIHDVAIVVGLFSLFQLEFDLSVLAAVLAVIGYSLNDTIVVYDRIRENFRRIRKGSPQEVTNTSVNQTLSRTLVTSATTLLVLVTLLAIGGEVIHNFSLALILGVLVGTYSSIYVASSAVLAMGVSKQDLLPVQKEGAELDERP